VANKKWKSVIISLNFEPLYIAATLADRQK